MTSTVRIIYVSSICIILGCVNSRYIVSHNQMTFVVSQIVTNAKCVLCIMKLTRRYCFWNAEFVFRQLSILWIFVFGTNGIILNVYTFLTYIYTYYICVCARACLYFFIRKLNIARVNFKFLYKLFILPHLFCEVLEDYKRE